jgi:hypothetical protein
MSRLLISLLAASAAIIPTPSSAQSVQPTRAVGVESAALAEVGPWGAAALPEGMSPMSSDLWRGANPSTLALAFGKVSADQRYPSIQILVRQAIFSGGAAPNGDIEIARTRFEAANRLGPAEAGARLVFGIPRLASDNGLATLAIDAGLRADRSDDACGLIEAVSAPPQGTAWLEARATCYALNNEADAANLSVDLAKGRGLTDTWLGRAIAAISGSVTAPPPFRFDSGQALALSIKGNLRPGASFIQQVDPAAISALLASQAFLDTSTQSQREALIRMGAERGVVSVSRVIIPEIITLPDELSIPVPAQWTQRILAAPTLAARSVEARLALAPLKGVMETQPGLMTLADVPIMVEVALWSGEGALAASIADLSPDPLDPRLALIVALYDPTKREGVVERRIEASAPDPVARRLAMRDAVIAWSAGLPDGASHALLIQHGLPWTPASNGGPRTALDFAAARGSKGEVALLVAVALQGVEPNQGEPETLVRAIQALVRVGLNDAARDLARDYLLATYVTLGTRSPVRSRVQPGNSAPPPPPVRPPAATAPAPAVAAPPVTAPRLAPRPTALQTPPIGRAPTSSQPPRARAQAPASAAPKSVQQPPQAASAPSPRAKPSWGTP